MEMVAFPTFDPRAVRCAEAMPDRNRRQSRVCDAIAAAGLVRIDHRTAQAEGLRVLRVTRDALAPGATPFPQTWPAVAPKNPVKTTTRKG